MDLEHLGFQDPVSLLSVTRSRVHHFYPGKFRWFEPPQDRYVSVFPRIALSPVLFVNCNGRQFTNSHLFGRHALETAALEGVCGGSFSANALMSKLD